MSQIAALVLAVVLGAPFGQATAAATLVDDQTMELELTVEAPDAQAVVARVIDPGADEAAIQTIAMAARENGTFGATFETRRLDAVVVFEVVESGDQSQPLSLSGLGLDQAVLATTATPQPEIVIDDESAGGLWLPLGLSLAALAALVVWFGMGMKKDAVPAAPDGTVTPDGAA